MCTLVCLKQCWCNGRDFGFFKQGVHGLSPSLATMISEILSLLLPRKTDSKIGQPAQGTNGTENINLQYINNFQ